VLERLNLPFTGADSKFYEPTRDFMKKVAISVDVLTPAWAFAYTESDMLNLSSTIDLSYPLIVKHFNSLGSIGLTPDSCVNNASELLREGNKMIST